MRDEMLYLNLDACCLIGRRLTMWQNGPQTILVSSFGSFRAMQFGLAFQEPSFAGSTSFIGRYVELTHSGWYFELAVSAFQE